MRRLLFLILICFLPFQLSMGQSVFNKSTYAIKKRMESRDSVYARIRHNQVKIDTLLSQLSDAKLCIDYCELDNSILSDSIAVIKSELETFKLLTTPDTTVFHTYFSQIPIPLCLESHVLLINKIVDLRLNIEMLEKRVEDLKKTIKRANLKEIIAEEIETDIMQINSLIVEIKGLDQSSLSEEQKQYFKPGLTERYNNFSIYFE